METAVGYPCDVLLKAQLTVKVYTKVANNFPWLDDVTTNRQTEVGTWDLVKVGSASKLDNLCFRRI